MSEKRTELGELGEFGIIDRINEANKIVNKETLLAIGDDAAILSPTTENMVVTNDLLMEGVHFDLSYAPLHHLGYKAVAVNVSDIAAMNAVPKQITVAIGLSNRFSVEAIDMLYRGIYAACEDYKVDLVGGDTTSSASGLVISVTAIGQAPADRLTKRSGTKPGDIICVTGDLGAAYIGLQILEREKQVFLTNPDMTPQLESYEYVVQRQLKPHARMDIIHDFKEMDLIPTAMIDISDGLASELLHLSKASKAGMRIFEDRLPVDKQTYDTAYELGIDATTCALNGGEDYELLFTIDKKDEEKLKKYADVQFIGEVQAISEGNKMVTKGDNIIDLKAQGWNHLKN